MTRAIFVALVLICGACAQGAASVTTPVTSATTSVTASPRSVPGRTEQGTFRSAALGRTMPFTVYLPPGYDADPQARYATAYLLHGGCGCMSEWADYGLISAADRLMWSGQIAPFIIVLPQGDQEYWVDHVIDRVTGANGEKWGTYVAKDVVPEIDRRYRTIARQEARALGGLSMGAHAAMQLPLNFPGIWSVLGAHSPSIRPLGDAPTYLGRSQAEYGARDPLTLIAARPDLARTYTWWIDDGDLDPWRAVTLRIHDKLTELGIAHEWHTYPGDHSAAYWSAHVEDYLRYYAGALCRASAGCPRVP